MLAHVVVVEEAQQFDLAQRALGIRLIVERVPDLLHRDFAARGCVSAGAHHAISPFADRLRAASERARVSSEVSSVSSRPRARRSTGAGWARSEALTLISPYFSATSNLVPRT